MWKRRYIKKSPYNEFIHTFTYKHACIHAIIHIHIHIIYIHSYIHVHICHTLHIHPYTYNCAYKVLHAYMYMHSCIHSHKNTLYVSITKIIIKSHYYITMWIKQFKRQPRISDHWKIFDDLCEIFYFFGVYPVAAIFALWKFSTTFLLFFSHSPKYFNFLALFPSGPHFSTACFSRLPWILLFLSQKNLSQGRPLKFILWG